MAPMATISEVIIEESEEEPHMGPRRQSPSIESTDDTDSVVAVYSTANRLDTTESTGLDIDDEFREDIDNSFFDYSLDEYMGILISMKPFRHQSSPSASSEPDDTVFETAIQEPIDEMSPVDTESRTSEARENQDETKERASRENNNSGDTCPLPSTPSTITRSDEEEGPKTPRTCIVCGVPSLMDFCGYCWRHFKTNLRPPRPKPRWKTVQQRKSWRRRKTTATCGPSNRDQDDAQRTVRLLACDLDYCRSNQTYKAAYLQRFKL
ncbi:unnamed protein product [Cyprideis torosa]|uniref:Uncharacterized protein n=1 Tax=Cyprideis torosa TaxID=163714 RepID=A0A7R8W8T5_9CRUS|nr:unnamed protein product [Cyprideis torosa]CAG0883842.1 unnamed protein product [Cyprideis torosa]